MELESKTEKGKEKMKLGEHVYTCKNCGKKFDRDKNAAKNLFNYKNLELAKRV